MLEILQRKAVPYTLVNISGAEADEYFYDHYVKTLRSDYIAQLQNALKQFPDYSFVTTGHSLGAALATIAGFDAVSSGTIPGEQMAVYNFGSPRVGNYEFAQAVEAALPTLFRVVHWKDMIPHVPFCQEDASRNCNKTGPNGESGGLASWPAYHVAQQAFYNEDFTQYKICNGGEDLTCADQFPFANTSFAEHKHYLGVSMLCTASEVQDEREVMENEGLKSFIGF